jgi:hypothetical protein
MAHRASKLHLDEALLNHDVSTEYTHIFPYFHDDFRGSAILKVSLAATACGLAYTLHFLNCLHFTPRIKDTSKTHVADFALSQTLYMPPLRVQHWVRRWRVPASDDRELLQDLL